MGDCLANPKKPARVILSLAKDLLFFRTRVESAIMFPNYKAKSRFFVATLLRMTLRHKLWSDICRYA
jgi:hypothetical protein